MYQSSPAEATPDQGVEPTTFTNAPAGALSYAPKNLFLTGVTTLTDGTSSSLVMMGSGTVLASVGGAPVPVSLDRYACKVTVQEVCVDWPEAFASGSSVTLGRIALVINSRS